mmetsp:Transcript_25705/g.46459  ORF Transcript_25705/g.46459 Transcript_25705/m.46459 type:complete len:216 (+) Transcript_25705:875-1522(+)
MVLCFILDIFCHANVLCLSRWTVHSQSSKRRRTWWIVGGKVQVSAGEWMQRTMFESMQASSTTILSRGTWTSLDRLSQFRDARMPMELWRSAIIAGRGPIVSKRMPIGMRISQGLGRFQSRAVQLNAQVQYRYATNNITCYIITLQWSLPRSCIEIKVSFQTSKPVCRVVYSVYRRDWMLTHLNLYTVSTMQYSSISPIECHRGVRSSIVRYIAS